MVLALLPRTAWAVDAPTSGTCGENLSWTLSSDGTLSISGYGPMTEFSTKYQAPWYGYAYTGGIKRIVINEQVTSIGRTAFADCSELTYVSIPATVESIGEYAFSNCSTLDKIVIPGSVTTMGNYIFQNCTNLMSVGPSGGNYNIQFGWTEVIPDNAFTPARQITSVVIPEGIKEIGESAFFLTNITNIQLPESLTNIGSYAFSNTKISSVLIPGKVTNIGKNAFSGCTDLTDISISAGVTAIGMNAFYNTGYYNNTVNWENDVLYIGNYLIKTNTSISGDYKIKDGTYCIADSAFSNSTQINYDALTSVIIPGSVAYIGQEAFYRCRNMAGVYFEGNAPTIYPGGMQGCSFYDHTKLYYIAGKEGWNVDTC